MLWRTELFEYAPEALVTRETTPPPDETPVPVRLAVWGLPAALSLTVSVAARVPVAVGVKVTLIVQFAPAARLVPQLLVWPKSPLLVPVMVMPLMLNEALPEFESVTP